MGGLAVGAWVAGRAASTMTPARALRTYAGLEAFIAACALGLPGCSRRRSRFCAGCMPATTRVRSELPSLSSRSCGGAKGRHGCHLPDGREVARRSDRSNGSERSVAFDAAGLYAVNIARDYTYDGRWRCAQHGGRRRCAAGRETQTADEGIRADPARSDAAQSRRGRSCVRGSSRRERFSEAWFLSPTHSGALEGLAEAYDRQGNRARAAEIRARTPAR